ncbi:hypothetical protein FD22_GL000185 [Loigolactobacillus coryniformis subsp. coryniformis KCTC 3167 = DSM 20001]|uniref:Transposase n=2 Tax=Loigolactobacillus coryniformis TaxID=1610 RepID=A0A0R1EX65_9LACO|nr:hypothetical protein FD22_GL000185 [Loigolactobacillus coryniformis subsp. coryniformis KCTC 3167 = DSM 20001]
MPWKALDDAYQLEFTKNLGRAAKPFRMLYGAGLIQQRMGLTDRGVVAAIRDTPALQYFIGLSEYKAVAPFSYSSLAHFRKRIADISELITNIINDTVRAKIEALVPFKVDTVITDATAVPVKIKYPQDTVLLNLEAMAIDMAHQLGVPNPRMYKREAKHCWTAFSRHPKQQRGGFHKQVKAQLQYVRRDLRYINEFLDLGATLPEKQAIRLGVIRILFDQQWYMYTHKTHRVENRIVSLQQPYIRPIQRGKANAKVEFGAKIDCSLSEGVIDIERLDFNAFSEGKDFKETLDHYFDLHGHYPDEVLADTLYRNRENLKLCKDLGIRICGPKLGRHPKHVNTEQRRKDTDAENRRGAIERRFAFMKGSLGLDLVNTRTAESLAVKIDEAIVLSNVLALMRVFAIPIFVLAESEGVTYQIRYKFTTKVEDMVA